MSLVISKTLWLHGSTGTSGPPVNQFQPSVSFHIESNNLIFSAILMTGFYINCKNGLKLFKGALLGLRQFLATESPLKMTKNYLYFTSKALFVLKIFKCCLDFLAMYRNGLSKKIRLIPNLMTSQNG